jgi:CRISPR-associated endoribonuclease Cas6
MRIHIKLTPNQETVPFNYQEKLVSKLHQWAGRNELHDMISLYSFSWLEKGKANGGGLNFEKGSQWFISAVNTNFLKKIVGGIQESPELAWGMVANEVLIQEDPFLSGETRFSVGSPVFIKEKRNDGGTNYIFFDNPSAGRLLTNTLRHKLDKANLNSEDVQVTFDKSYYSARTKKITYKGIVSIGSVCSVIIKGNPEQLAFAWNVGVGNSTGIGFGSLI